MLAGGVFFALGELDGRTILQEIKKPESKYSPATSVNRILEKVPAATVAPLLEESFQVAMQLAAPAQGKSGYTLVSSGNLPSAAMQALSSGQGRRKKATATSRGLRRGKRSAEGELIYLPKASLRLDLDAGSVLVCWDKQRFPLSFADRKLEFYVNGQLAERQSFIPSVGYCMLEDVFVSVKPQVKYDVEIKLLSKDKHSDSFVEVSSLEQSFTRSKPGCFEFIRHRDGMFRFREPNERISRARTVAYLVKDGYRIEPGSGMRALSEYETSDAWSDLRLFLFEVEPGASGAVLDDRTGDEIAFWQERYSCKVNKQRIIGETSSGVDLYGHVPSKLGINGGLPSITIESFDGMAALDDLDVICEADGQRISIPRHVVWDDEYGDTQSAEIQLIPSESSLFGWHIENCIIEARQKSIGGKPVFKYRFAVVPVQEFQLASAGFEYGSQAAIADYRFKAMLPITIENLQGDTKELSQYGIYQARTMLKDEFLSLRITSNWEGRKTTEALLALAAIEITVPSELEKISQKRPVCLADAIELSPGSGNIKIRSNGWRYNRSVYISLGYAPMFLKELKRPIESSFNMLSDESLFVPDENSQPEEKPLKLTILYGDDLSQGRLAPALTDIELLRCQEGYGFASWNLVVTSEGTHELVFDKPALCNLKIKFTRARLDRLIGETELLKGENRATVPGKVIRTIDVRKDVLMTIAPTDWFGDVDNDLATNYVFDRKAI